MNKSLDLWWTSGYMKRKHLWLAIDEQEVKTRCNHDRSFFDWLLDGDMPKCLNCLNLTAPLPSLKDVKGILSENPDDWPDTGSEGPSK